MEAVCSGSLANPPPRSGGELAPAGKPGWGATAPPGGRRRTPVRWVCAPRVLWGCVAAPAARGRCRPRGWGGWFRSGTDAPVEANPGMSRSPAAGGVETTSFNTPLPGRRRSRVYLVGFNCAEANKGIKRQWCRPGLRALPTRWGRVRRASGGRAVSGAGSRRSPDPQPAGRLLASSVSRFIPQTVDF